MAVRVRADERVLCAAMHPAESGDVYLDDTVHYLLSVVLHVLVTEPHERHRLTGEWWWEARVPEGVEVERWWT